MQNLPPIVERFIEDFGLALESEGLPRTAARLIGLLLMLDEGGDLNYLARQLRVSRASISMNTRLLESLGAIERRTVPGRRRVVFRAVENRRRSLAIEAILLRMRRTADIIHNMRRLLPRELKGADGRLRRVEEYYDIMIGTNEATLHRLLEEEGDRSRRKKSRRRR